MSVVYAWSLLLAVSIILPIWWHRRRRQHADNTVFAAAQFLPTAQAAQKRAWRWQHRLLLILRIIVLLLLTAILSDLSFAFRQQTSLVSLARWQADSSLQDAIVFCAKKTENCAIVTDDIWLWLAQHEREWPDDAALTVHAFADEIAMPALQPRFAHHLQLDMAQRDNPPAILKFVISGQNNESIALQKELLSANTNARFNVDKGEPADLAFYVNENAAQSAVNAHQHIVFSEAISDINRFTVKHHDWFYSDRNGIRFYHTKRPMSVSEWRELLRDTEQLKVQAIATSTPSSQLTPTLSHPRLWPSDSLRDALLLLLIFFLIVERVLHYAIYRSR